MNVSLQPDERLRNGIFRIWLECIDEPLAWARDDSADLVQIVHNTRKNFKRVRALLRFLRPSLGERRFEKENIRYRDFSRHLAALRDSAAMLEVLSLIEQRDVDEVVLESVRALQDTFSQSYDALLKDISSHENPLRELEPDLFSARSICVELSSRKTTDAQLFNGLARIYRTGRKRMIRAIRKPSAESFHEWRKSVKYLWHITEVIIPVWPQIYGPLTDELHTLSSLLGDEHDMSVLLDLSEDLEMANRSLFTKTVLNLREEKRMDAIRLGRRLFAETIPSFRRRNWVCWAQYRRENQKAH